MGVKKLLLVLFITITVNGFGQFYTYFHYPNSVDLFGLCEVSFKIPKTYSNPYDPDTICVYAEFTAPDNSIYRVDGFYYEDYTFQQHSDGYEVATHNSSSDGWRIRFTPSQVGTWTFIIRAFDVDGSINLSFMNVSQTFSCTSVSNADGFISLANSRFLKRDVVRNSQRQYHSFFPIGPNVAWYDNKNNNSTKPLGIYQYARYIDSLYNNCNYMRVFLTRYQHLSLYGPEYTQTENGQPKVYFDSLINQKDSAELDNIITYAIQHNIVITTCIFSCGDFCYTNNMDPSDPSKWENNPFQTILGESNDCACSFFTNEKAIRITKNLIRYIISRWGYATNVMCWELWNEVDQIFEMCEGYKHIEQDVQEWHNDIARYIHGIDPFNHLISTSLTSMRSYAFPLVFENLDYVQAHNYEHIQNAWSINQLQYRLYNKTMNCQAYYPTKPFFMEEFGFAQGQNVPKYEVKDPKGIDLHNSLWSSLFYTSIGTASFWWWHYVNSCGLFHRFNPLLNFSQNLPLLSDSFSAHHTGDKIGHELVFPNNLATYYMINAAQDTIYGWSQDTAFAYQSLRWLTDSTYIEQTIWGPILYFKEDAVYDPLGYVYTLNCNKRPSPSSNSNTISLPITNQPVGSRYKLTWYDSETGQVLSPGEVVYASVHLNNEGEKVVSFNFPSSIRNIQQHSINNTFGDAVFSLILNNPISQPERNHPIK